MTLDYGRAYDPSEIPDLDQARQIKAREWHGTLYEIRNHLDGFVFVTHSTPPTATVHSLVEAEIAFNRALITQIADEANTRVRWDDDNLGAVTLGAEGWVMAWLHNGKGDITEHGDWEAAHLALADRLDRMAEGPLYTGSSTAVQDVVAAYLQRAACDIRSDLARVRLGDAVRAAQPVIQKERRVSELAQGLDVDRKFVYRVFNGTEWIRREPARP